MFDSLFSNGKKCGACKEIKDLSEFGRSKSSKDGLNRICKLCNNLNKQKHRSKHISQGKCRDCSNLVVPNKQHCIYHHIWNLVKSNSKKGQNKARQCKITKQMADQYLAQWVRQGGLQDGTGATCWKTNKPISFLDGTASIGHRKPASEFSNGLAFNDPENIAFEHIQSNLESMGHSGTSNHSQYWESMGTEAQRKLLGHRRNGAQLGRKLKSIYLSQPVWYCPYYPDIQLTPKTMSLDHIIPISQGGTNSLDNLQFVSRMANMQKHNMAHKEYCKKYNIKATPNPLRKY